MNIERLDCLTNRTWRNPLLVEATLWRQYAEVAYGRKDGHINESTPLAGSPPIPEPFDIQGLFGLYNVTYGLANIFDTNNRTPEVEATIRYQAMHQISEWLKGDVGVKGAQGDEDRYWRTLAGRMLILWPLEDCYANDDKKSWEVTTGSSTNQSTRLFIPTSSVVAFLVLSLSVLIWAAVCLWSVSRGIVAPNSSLFPEIDFGSKCVQFERDYKLGEEVADIEDSVGMGVLYPLSNAESKTIASELNTVNIYAGSIRNIDMECPHITLSTSSGILKPLRGGVEYR